MLKILILRYFCIPIIILLYFKIFIIVYFGYFASKYKFFCVFCLFLYHIVSIYIYYIKKNLKVFLKPLVDMRRTIFLISLKIYKNMYIYYKFRQHLYMRAEIIYISPPNKYIFYGIYNFFPLVDASFFIGISIFLNNLL